MSPRAACRLETLGFGDAYDYVAGKQDWIARGLPTEGEKASVPTAAQVVRDDVVVCRLDETMGAVRERVERSPYGFALVVSRTGILLGRLRRAALEGDPQATSEQVMEAGLSTVRVGKELGALVERLRERSFRYAVVTMPDGKLVGVVCRPDAEERLRSEE